MGRYFKGGCLLLSLFILFLSLNPCLLTLSTYLFLSLKSGEYKQDKKEIVLFSLTLSPSSLSLSLSLSLSPPLSQ